MRINEPRSPRPFQRIRHPVLPEQLSDVAAMFNKVNKISRRCCAAGMLLTARRAAYVFAFAVAVKEREPYLIVN